MNVKHLIAAAFAVAGTAAMAGEITIVNDNFVAQKTRAEVRAEVLQARADGSFVQIGEGDTSLPIAAKSTLTRDQVRAELRNAPKEKIMMFNSAA